MKHIRRYIQKRHTPHENDNDERRQQKYPQMCIRDRAKTVKEAAKATHKRLRQVEFRTQAPDHPILWAADESYYLKFFIFQVVEEK